MKNQIFFVGLTCALVLLAGCSSTQSDVSDQFCTSASSGATMSLAEAKEIAAGGECGQQGTLKETQVCNENSGTWWLDFQPFAEKETCTNPACVVSVDSKSAEINWRCTGAIPPEEPAVDETCTGPTGQSMALSKARQIAAATCAKDGTVTDEHSCNDYTGTWWLGFTPSSENPGCNPACVVSVQTGDAEINWRCTGLLPE
jgi:hypothetical protein